MINRTDKIATAVLNILDEILELNHNQRACQEPYQSGREHGHAVVFTNSSAGDYYQKKVAFSEYWASDSIVVYFGEIADFSPQGNTPSEAVYENKQFFAYDNLYGAARFIVEYFKS